MYSTAVASSILEYSTVLMHELDEMELRQTGRTRSPGVGCACRRTGSGTARSGEEWSAAAPSSGLSRGSSPCKWQCSNSAGPLSHAANSGRKLLLLAQAACCYYRPQSGATGDTAQRWLWAEARNLRRHSACLPPIGCGRLCWHYSAWCVAIVLSRLQA